MAGVLLKTADQRCKEKVRSQSALHQGVFSHREINWTPSDYPCKGILSDSKE